MMISKWLIFASLAVGAGFSNLIGSPSVETSSACPPDRVCKIGSNCYINGTLRIPCPDDYPNPEPSPEIQPPG